MEAQDLWALFPLTPSGLLLCLEKGSAIQTQPPFPHAGRGALLGQHGSPYALPGQTRRLCCRWGLVISTWLLHDSPRGSTMTIPPLVGHSVDHENQCADSLNLSSVWHAAFQPQELPGWHCVSASSTTSGWSHVAGFPSSQCTLLAMTYLIVLLGCVSMRALHHPCDFKGVGGNTETQTSQGELTSAERDGQQAWAVNPEGARPSGCVNLFITIIIFSKQRISSVKPPGHQIKERGWHSWTAFSSQLAGKAESRQCPGNCLTRQQSTEEGRGTLETDSLFKKSCIASSLLFLFKTVWEQCPSPRGLSQVGTVEEALTLRIQSILLYTETKAFSPKCRCFFFF